LKDTASTAAARIAKVQALGLNLPVEIPGVQRKASFSACLVRIETEAGLVGHGFTAITEEEVVAAAINEVAAPALIGEDALAHERVWDRLYWLLSPRGQTGYASHAIAAIDCALWDIKGKALGQPVWRLLGGARSRVPVYATFGFSFYDRDQLAEAARQWMEQGYRRLKMVVGHEGLQRRDAPRPQREVILEDARRVRAVRDAAGDDAELFIDANCSLDPYHALELARRVLPLGISFFEEPITQNDAALLADLRRRAGIAIAAGQNEGLAWRFRDLLQHQAVDVLQPNVVISGGFTQCLRVAGMASAFNVPIANGGAWPFHNMHLHAGLAHGGLVEYHYPAVLACRTIYRQLPEPQEGWLTLPDAPGLGFEPDEDCVKEIAKRPSARGRGKG
jgi:L-alanine-DL-glutamate epimerase-like enolase superfamily enzyme